MEPSNEAQEKEPVDDSTPLHLAARGIDLGQMQKLFEGPDKATVDVNAITASDGQTPLWDLVSAAAEYDEQHDDAIPCLRLLLDHGADVHHQASNGATALHRCATSWCCDTSRELAEVLLEYGADVNANKSLKTPPEPNNQSHVHTNDGCECGAHVGTVLGSLYKAATGHDLQLSSGSQTQPHEPLVTPIFLAVGRNCNLPVTKLLIEHGADVNIVDPDAGTPMHIAAGAGNRSNTASDNEEIVSLLLSQPGAKDTILIKNKQHFLPIHLAAQNPQDAAKIFKLIVEAGGSPVDEPISADTPRENHRGLTPLMLVCQNARSTDSDDRPTKAVEYLLDRGADPNRTAALGQSALMLAVLAKQLPIVKLLVARGADVTALIGNDSSGDTGANALHAAVITPHPGLVRWLVAEAACCAVDKRDSDGYTALIHAAGYARGDGAEAVETVRVLVEELGADIEAEIPDGRRALHFAAFKGQSACARELIRLGADVEAVDVNGWTALHFAARYHKPDVVGVLADDGGAQVGKRVTGGPRPKTKDGEEIEIQGFTAADLAKVVRGGEETVSLLLAKGDTLSEATKGYTDEDLLEDKGNGCCVM
ncbi:ankyrin repeat-containing domain protein [Apodospora peruviana]|uniref:Ankyrin repeat-containing domain protein n=1 Tax=Apodospora peruviana TaxID=516989 RepID=A0AAE0HS26_9PEZI|nr:ankyrin repeat-containing domain protein [Apodospora peruviana]KAK3313686.1 ankyrin repeat-containing domain protein [Apodospora peruviana]